MIAAILTLWANNTSSQTTGPGGNVDDLPAVTNIVNPGGEASLADHFDNTLKTINKAFFDTLFFDVTFGAFKKVEKDQAGKDVHEQLPVELTADADFQAVLATRSGVKILNSDGVVKVVTVPKGAKYQPVSADGTPQTTVGEIKIVGPTAPFLVVFLATGAVFFTFWHGFINIRGFKHAIDIVRGKYTSKSDVGEIPPFRALTSALSATVGLGNISGVAIAVKTGGPGAIFWMMFLGIFGMTAKFHESSLAQMFRIKNPDGSVSGGPMYTLDHGFKQLGIGPLGKILAIFFAIFCLFGALGGGNMFQSNQAFEGFYDQFVKTPSITEQARKDLPIEVLRPLLTNEQINAMGPGDLVMDNPQADIRDSYSDQKVRKVLRPSQIEKVLDEEAVASDNRAHAALKSKVSIGFGLVFASLVGVVVVGGITRIGAATSKIVPGMCLLYVGGCLLVICFNINQIPGHIGLIFSEALKMDSAYGGLIGVMIVGFTRAAFSSEAGMGSSAIAHSAAQQSEPLREGFVASLEPFIDTIIICFMTAMVVLITDAYRAPELLEVSQGSAVTLYAFEQTRLGAWFPYVLSVSIILFAFSTMISWCYYGERAWGYLFGLRSVVIFRLIFVGVVFVGAVASLGPVVDFSDAMLLTMALPNIFGGVVLAGLVKRELKAYWARHKSGQMPAHAPDMPADPY